MTTIGNQNFGGEQQYKVSVSVTGVVNGAPNTVISMLFDKFNGGDAQAPVVKNRPGGMGTEQTFTGLPSYTDITVSKVFIVDQDWTNVWAMNQMVGRGAATITLQPLDNYGVAYGNPAVYSGRLIAVKPGQTDSNSSAVRTIELDFAIEQLQA